MAYLVLSGLFTIIASWWCIGRLIPMLSNHRITDSPNQRSLHQGVVPRGGGLVIVALVLVAILIVAIMSQRYQMFGALAITMIAWASVSWSDDRIGLGAGIRLIWQSLFAVLMIMAFGYVDAVLYAHNQWLSLSWFGALLTFFGILWLANLYNFMDGMDGLAASQTIVAALTFAIWFWQYGDQSIALICLVLASSCYGFLLWNWHPAKIFMGDVGSITIGALFATVMIIGATRYDFTIVSSILLFGVFVADASVTLLRRLVNGEKIWQAHRSHYYQRLALAGISHKKIVLAEIILMLICSLIATTTLLYRDTIPVAILVEAIVLALAMAVVTRIETSKQKP